VTDVLRLAIKGHHRGRRVAALWVSDLATTWKMKLSRAEHAADGAKQCRRLAARLFELGVAQLPIRATAATRSFSRS